MPENVKLKYRANVEKTGWQEWRTEGESAGTEGKSLRLEASQIEVEGTEEYTVMYKYHIQDIGWQGWREEGEISGTIGQNKRLEAIQIKLVKKEKKTKLFIESSIENKTYYNEDKTISVSGWRMANVSNNKIKAYVDEKEIASENIFYYERMDVIKAIKGYGTQEQNPTPGFEVKINTKELKEGKHTFKLNVVSSKRRSNTNIYM